VAVKLVADGDRLRVEIYLAPDDAQRLGQRCARLGGRLEDEAVLGVDGGEQAPKLAARKDPLGLLVGAGRPLDVIEQRHGVLPGRPRWRPA
jgi:hypothetical protein